MPHSHRSPFLSYSIAAIAIAGAASAQVQPAVACQPSWANMFGGSQGLDGTVQALTVFNDGSGPALFVAGGFANAGSVPAANIAKWDGTGWSALGAGLRTGSAMALLPFDDGSGPALYAGGAFLIAGDLVVRGVARWNGATWSPLGGGFDNLSRNAYVASFVVFDDGTGPALFAGGYFDSTSGTTIHNIAKWNGAGWTPLGAGTNGHVDAMTVFDDGSGPALYIGGSFTAAGGVIAYNIVKWDGVNWTTLNHGTNGNVLALAVFDDGSGPALYAGGFFTSAGERFALNFARWDGAAWLGGVFDNPLHTAHVNALRVSDDGSGPALYAGGYFTIANGAPANCVAKCVGPTCSPLGQGTVNDILALCNFDTGHGPDLYVGGVFNSAGPFGSHHLAEWANPIDCGQPGISMCEPSIGGVIDCPCGNPPMGSGLGCNNSSNTGGAQLSATGIARLSYDTVAFSAGNMRPLSPKVVLQGNSASPTGVVFGQGVRCISGSFKRLYVKLTTTESITVPEPGDPHVSVRSAVRGDVIAPGTHRYYGVYYRDPATSPGGCVYTGAFNITQQLDVLWSP